MIYTAWRNDDNRAIGEASRPNSNGVVIKTLVSASITGIVAVEIAAAPDTTGLYSFITSLLVTNADASVGTWVNITDEDGTVLCTGFAGPNGGGFTLPYGNTPPRTLNPNKKLYATCETAADVRVSLVLYENF